MIYIFLIPNQQCTVHSVLNINELDLYLFKRGNIFECPTRKVIFCETKLCVLPLCESRNALLKNTASREMTLFDEYSICLKMKAVVCLLGDILFFLLLCLFGLLAFKIKIIALHYTE